MIVGIIGDINFLITVSCFSSSHFDEVSEKTARRCYFLDDKSQLNEDLKKQLDILVKLYAGVCGVCSVSYLLFELLTKSVAEHSVLEIYSFLQQLSTGLDFLQ